MKYWFQALLITINLNIQPMDKQDSISPSLPTSAHMDEENIPKIHTYNLPHHHRTGFPVCADLLECLECCCHATYVLASICFNSARNKRNHPYPPNNRDHLYDDDHRR